MAQRLLNGSVKLGARVSAAVNPSGSVFKDLRPPMPDEFVSGLSGLARGLVNGKQHFIMNHTKLDYSHKNSWRLAARFSTNQI